MHRLANSCAAIFKPSLIRFQLIAIFRRTNAIFQYVFYLFCIYSTPFSRGLRNQKNGFRNHDFGTRNQRIGTISEGIGTKPEKWEENGTVSYFQNTKSGRNRNSETTIS